VAIIAAAGLGRRAGGPKVDLRRADDPRPFLERSIDALRVAGASAIVAVVRSPHHQRQHAADTHLLCPEPPPATMIHSIIAALDHVEYNLKTAKPDGLLLAPVDAPAALELLPTWLPEALDAHAGQAIVPGFEGHTGHPAWIPRSQWPKLRTHECLVQGARAALTDAVIWPCAHPQILENVNVPTH
jgi:CTP:molybdopterin cytidylyltransferase MocA